MVDPAAPAVESAQHGADDSAARLLGDEEQVGIALEMDPQALERMGSVEADAGQLPERDDGDVIAFVERPDPGARRPLGHDRLRASAQVLRGEMRKMLINELRAV